MSAQPASSARDRDAEFALYRRRDHANQEAMQNLAIALISEAAGAEMPPNVRALISALQGAHGGGRAPFEEFERDYLSIGRQLQFTGTNDAIRGRVRRWLELLDEWQYSVGRRLFTVIPGGSVIGFRPDGSPIRKKTVFVDHLKPVSDEGVQRARRTPLWREHPGKALEAEAPAVVKALPALGTRAESGAEKKPVVPLSLAEYAARQEKRGLTWAEGVAEEIEQRDEDTKGGGAAWVKKLAKNLYKLAESLERTEGARNSWVMPDDDDDPDPNDEAPSVTSHTCNTTEAETADAPSFAETEIRENPSAPLRNTGDTQLSAYLPDGEPNMLYWALFWAVEQGIPVFPLYETFDAVCACRKGSECKQNGKHPRWRKGDLEHGVMNATLDTEKISEWWALWPFANIGGAMGARSRLHVVDIDPKNDGNTTVHDLCEVYGDAWLKAPRIRTGSGGDHLYYLQPDEIDLRNTAGALGPGIDSRGTGGYVVLPPSLHASGARYEVVDFFAAPPLEAWIIERLTATDEQPSRVVDFQARRARSSTGGAAFPEGERNKGLFGWAIGRWRYGWAEDQVDLHAQLSEKNAACCSPPLDGGEVAELAAHIARDYAHLRGIDAEVKATA